MAQPIVANKTDSPLPLNQSVRLLPVKSAAEPPTLKEQEQTGTPVAVAKVISLWRARRLVETHFAAGQEALGRFAATFIRVNAYPDASLTEVIRARRIEGVAVNDTFAAAEIVVRQGQLVDRKALDALAILREKSLIGALQTKLEQEQSLSSQIKAQTKGIALGLGGVCVVLFLILWRLRPARGQALATLSPPADPGTLSLSAGSELSAASGVAEADAGWQNRALLAEAKAERVEQALRTGVLRWMRDRLFSTLFRHRSELLDAQQKAEAEMVELEQRLAQLQTPLQERIHAYEARIVELEKELAEKGEANRKLLGARIHVARQHLTVERERRDIAAN
jgi:hypothetical protein